MQLRNIVSVTSNGSGVIAGYLPFDPSATLSSLFGGVANFTEWSSIQNLWSRVKLKEFTVSMVPSYIDDTKGDNFFGLCVASNATASYSNPSSYSNAADNVDSILWNPVKDLSGSAKVMSYRPKGLGWGPCSSPATNTGLGCPGSFIFYGTGFPVSTAIIGMKIVGTYIFDSRT